MPDPIIDNPTSDVQAPAEGRLARSEGGGMTTYVVTVGSEERLRFRMDVARAEAPVTINQEQDATVFQTADAAHDPWRMAEMLNGWCRSEGGEAWGEEEEDDWELGEGP